MVREGLTLATRSGSHDSGRRTRRLLGTALSGLAAAAVLAACGASAGSYGSSGSSGSGSSQPAAAGNGPAVSVRQLSGVGTVLVSSAGKTIYSPEQEASGKILCTGPCLGFWLPVTVGSGASPMASGNLSGALGTIHRPDNGQTQVTYNGKPLYTFRLDSAPGQAHGNNFSDSFGGTKFNWLAVSTSGAPNAPAAPSSSSSSSGGGYGGSGGGYGGGY